MFGTPLYGPTNGFCDNESIVLITTIPESTLQKKHNLPQVLQQCV
jgi:hypothetical protein